jgi:hypothetical protein
MIELRVRMRTSYHAPWPLVGIGPVGPEVVGSGEETLGDSGELWDTVNVGK